MAYIQLPIRTENDSNCSADVNQLQMNIETLKGGEGGEAPLATIADLKTDVERVDAAMDTVEHSLSETTASISMMENSIAAISALIEAIVPAGTILTFAGAVAPSGWGICDGSAYSRGAYPKLFNAIGTTWGAGNGTSTFNIPDLRAATIRGAGESAIFAHNVSLSLGEVIDDTLQGHLHKPYNNINSLVHFISTGGNIGPAGGTSLLGYTTTGDVTTSSPYGTARVGSETTGKARAVHFIIRLI